jgi:hypothetical protein
MKSPINDRPDEGVDDGTNVAFENPLMDRDTSRSPPSSPRVGSFEGETPPLDDETPDVEGDTPRGGEPRCLNLASSQGVHS